jgi:GNAT superfamily N-acetyltransferase
MGAVDPVEEVGSPVPIRCVVAEDMARLQAIERAAGRSFAEVGMPEIADDEPLSISVLDGYRQAGWAWVAVDPADEPVAYLLANVVDGDVHVEQVSVHPDYARRGIGRSLLEHVARQAAAAGASALTLTTFEHVPWNAPYYRRCGFHVLGEDDWSRGLRRIREREAAHGLNKWPRVCMRRDLARPAAATPPS